MQTRPFARVIVALWGLSPRRIAAARAWPCASMATATAKPIIAMAQMCATSGDLFK